ncbi:hypothetical protein H107_02044, partial [Trichophyton rubrum CBS 202.88]
PFLGTPPAVGRALSREAEEEAKRREEKREKEQEEKAGRRSRVAGWRSSWLPASPGLLLRQRAFHPRVLPEAIAAGKETQKTARSNKQSRSRGSREQGVLAEAVLVRLQARQRVTAADGRHYDCDYEMSLPSCSL